MDRNVVITGLGAVSALGVGAASLWEGLLKGASGIRPIAGFDASGFPCQLGGEVGSADQPFSAKDHVPKHYRKAVKVMARDIELAVAAAKAAVVDAGLATRATLPEDSTEPATYRGERMGCHIGAGLIAETDAFWQAAASDPAAARWQRDRELLKVAGSAREQRTRRAWETLRQPAPVPG